MNSHMAPDMTAASLLVRVLALQADFSHAQRRIVAAIEADDLRGLVEASHRQAALCTEQGEVLAQYVATAAPDRLNLTPAERDRVRALARQLRGDDEGEPRTKTAG